MELEEDAEELTVGPGLAVCSVGWEVVMCWKVETGNCTKKSNGCWLFKSKCHILLEVSIGIDMVLNATNDLLTWKGECLLGG